MNFWPFSKQSSAISGASKSPAAPRPSLHLRILTLNIRYATSTPFTNEKPWSERRFLVMNQLQHETRYLNSEVSDAMPLGRSNAPAASIICLQEVLHTQLIDIMKSLNDITSASAAVEAPLDGPVWAHVGVGRDDGHTKGEYSPILYTVHIFNLLHSETVWLSPTPDEPSKGWDAGSIRIVTVAVLEYKSTGQRVLASSTHLDNTGTESRKHSVEIILKVLKRVEKKWAKNGRLPIFLAGDFNSFPDQEAYLLMSQSNYMYDLRGFIKPRQRYNDSITFTGFQPEKDKEEQGRIDFIWLGPTNSMHTIDERGETPDDARESLWAVDGYAVLPNVFDDGVYLSDHRCVVGDVSLLQ